MSLGEHLAGLFKRMQRMPPFLVRIEHATPDLIPEFERQFGTSSKPLTGVAALTAVPIVQNTALRLGTVRMVMSDGTHRDSHIEPFYRQIRERA